MKSLFPASFRGRPQGLALIIVITTISLISVLVVAIFSITRTEFKATQGFVAARSAKQLGDIATSIVQAQITNAHNTNVAATARTIHATQPGMIRVYNAIGTFKQAHKLYSSSQMTVQTTNEAILFSAAHQIPTDWKTNAANRARYVDLNEPVIRPALTAGAYAMNFPIIDPRAAAAPTAVTDPAAVEGFSYSKSTVQVGTGGSVTFNEVVTPTEAGADTNKLRLPMPVEWLYVLQDGTTGVLDAQNQFVSSNPDIEATPSNPIVGRVAFWTDDESCKVNINTASEPTFFASPYFYHKRDYQWANYPPATGEYQRYPGHPATVALSAVLAPGLTLDPLKPGVKLDAIVQTKELIYALAPKIAQGGSKSGTLPFVRDDFSSARGEDANLAQVTSAATARGERLFASVDELIFSDGAYNGNLRPASSVLLPEGGGKYLFSNNVIERSRFFLTAQSRAPEFSIHGMPRVTMWPVADESLGQNRRTSFDNMIALCSTLQPATTGAAINNSYFFRRAKAHDALFDVTGSSSTYGSSNSLQRNSRLLNYLYQQMNGLNFPGTSASGIPATKFGTKYGNLNIAQLAVQFFDYIRSTNLYDGVLARENDGRDGLNSSGQALTGEALYNKNDQKAGTYRTYTNHRVSPPASGSLRDGSTYTVGSTVISDDESVFPGHGQVTPALWPGPSGATAPGNARGFRGIGRMFTLSEIGFQIICTADGKDDELYAVTVDGGSPSGGGCAPKGQSIRASGDGRPLLPFDPGTTRPAAQPQGSNMLGFQRYYSNFPPLDPNDTGLRYGCDPSDPAKHPSKHPGYYPENWNMTLATGQELGKNQKRVQVMVMLEGFCPMAGWTKIHPEWAIELDAQFLRTITLDGQILFPTTDNVIIKSNENVYEDTDVYSSGGHFGPTAIAGGRSVKGWGKTQIGNDTDPYVSAGARQTSTLRYIDNAPGHTGLNNWALVSEFVTVSRTGPLTLAFGQRDMVIKIYDSHERAGANGQHIQTIRLALPDITVPAPALVYGGERRLQGDSGGTNPVSKLPANRGELNYAWWTDDYGRDRIRRPLPGPHWWCFNRMGCIGRMTGQPNPAFGQAGQSLFLSGPSFDNEFSGAADQLLHGRLDTRTSVFGDGTPADGFSIIPPEVTTGYMDESSNPWTGSDVIRTFVPSVGDYRIVAARDDVPASMWQKHPVWAAVEGKPPGSQPRTIHSFTTHVATTENGVVLPTNGIVDNLQFKDYVSKNQMLLGDQVPYTDSRIPDLPPAAAWVAASLSFGDFDNGIANSRDGPYVNKPDEGNFYAKSYNRHNATKFYRSGYFFEPWHNSDDWRSGVYMTPNRMVSSPVMFGSLPTGVWNGGSATAPPAATTVLSGEGRPWQTLLFRPYSMAHNSAKTNHPGNVNPRDHYLLDMFTMPIVEPYAISEPLSTAGKINLNYQIMPFTNIRRATGLHALMKGEFMTAIPSNADVNRAKTFRSSTSADWTGGPGDRVYDEVASGERKFWHRPINVTATLGQFDQKFSFTGSANIHSAAYSGLFRSPSQICEMHLIPDVSAGASDGGESVGSVGGIDAKTTGAQVETIMRAFWQNHSPTGDNTRERPYANLYPRVTTRSNTFRVHVRAQVVKKARSVAANEFDPDKDAIVSEYRGSSLIERFIDPTSVANPLPDYAAAADPLTQKPIELYYQFRTLESKRFSP